MGEADFYQQSPEKVNQVTGQLKKVENEIKQLYLRWEELEN
jgi:hypothetical protein